MGRSVVVFRAGEATLRFYETALCFSTARVGRGPVVWPLIPTRFRSPGGGPGLSAAGRPAGDVLPLPERVVGDGPAHGRRDPALDAAEHPLASLIRVDGQVRRLMGKLPAEAPALPQTSLRVLPTRTIYEFDDGQVHCTLTFLRPALPEDLDAMALPLSYITWEVRSVDGKQHSVSIYDSTSALLAVNQPGKRSSGRARRPAS